jgi:hypothetical protein
VASSSGPRRTRQPARDARRYDPKKKVAPKKVHSRKVDLKKADSKKADPEDDDLGKADWDRTLVRFRAEFDTPYNVHSGQPSGGFVPEMALARVTKFIKDDFKRSVSGCFYCVLIHHFTNLSTWQQPLRDTRAGEGKRSRDFEDYLKGLLRAIRRVEPSPTLAEGESDENDTMVAALSRRKCFFSISSNVVN